MVGIADMQSRVKREAAKAEASRVAIAVKLAADSTFAAQYALENKVSAAWSDVTLQNQIAGLAGSNDATQRARVPVIRARINALGGQQAIKARWDELMRDPSARAYYDKVISSQYGGLGDMVSNLVMDNAVPIIGAIATYGAFSGTDFFSGLINSPPSVAPQAAGFAAVQAAPVAIADVAVAGVGAAEVSTGAGILSALKNVTGGGGVDTIFDTITGAGSKVITGAVDLYAQLQGAQLQKAQIDLVSAQTLAAQRSAQQPTFTMPSMTTANGATNWTMIGLIGAAMLGVVMMVRK